MFLGEHLIIPCLVDTQVATLTAVDYDGKQRTSGGDPVTVQLTGPLEDTQLETVANNSGHQHGNNSSHNVCVIDHKNGQYTISLRLSICGRYFKTIIYYSQKNVFY